MHIFIILSLISSVFSCNYRLDFNETNYQALVIPDEAFEYEFNFVFNKNVSYEFGMIRYFGERCKMFLNCDCPMNEVFNPSYASSSGATYYLFDNGKDVGQKFSMTVASTCSKYKKTPFTDYKYYCDSSSSRKSWLYAVKVVTILINDDVEDVNVVFNYTQNRKFTDEELSDTRRFKCSCTNKTAEEIKNENAYFEFSIIFCGIISFFCCCLFHKYNKNETTESKDICNNSDVTYYGSTDKV